MVLDQYFRGPFPDLRQNLAICFFTIAINNIYRKSFRIRDNLPTIALQVTLAVGLFFLSDMGPVESILFVMVIITLTWMAFKAMGINDFQPLMSNPDIQDCLNFVVLMVTLSIFQRSSNILKLDKEAMTEAWRFVPILAILQMIRNPVGLKNSLRHVRVAMGPATILTKLFIAFHQVRWHAHDKMLVTAIAAIIFIFVFLAGVILRPDNTEVLGLILNKRMQEKLGFSTMVGRAYVHAHLNISSVLLSIIIVGLSFVY